MAKLNKLEKLAGNAQLPPAMPTDEHMRYRAQEALHTIHKAEECKRDKDLMRHVKKLAKGQMKAVCK